MHTDGESVGHHIKLQWRQIFILQLVTDPYLTSSLLSFSRIYFRYWIITGGRHPNLFEIQDAENELSGTTQGKSTEEQFFIAVIRPFHYTVEPWSKTTLI